MNKAKNIFKFYFIVFFILLSIVSIFAIRNFGLRRPYVHGSPEQSYDMIVVHLRAAERYRIKNGLYPKTSSEMWSIYLNEFQLEALVGRDSWGHPLHFHHKENKFSETITICSYGRDYFWGGKGDNVDLCVCVPELYCN